MHHIWANDHCKTTLNASAFKREYNRRSSANSRTAITFRRCPSGLLGSFRKEVLISLGATCLNAVGLSLILSNMTTYLISTIGVDESQPFLANSLSQAFYIGLISLTGALCDRFGRKTVPVTASILFMGLNVPLLSLRGGASPAEIIAIQLAFGALLTFNDGTFPGFLSEVFPTKVRYSDFAFSFNSAHARFGGTKPFVAPLLIGATGSKGAPG